MKRESSTLIISAYRATSIVDTPMRKVEVLEAQDGTVLIRATEYRTSFQADIHIVHLEHIEAQALGSALLSLEDAAKENIGRKRA